MKQTLEEAAREYTNENMWYPGETSYESDIIAMEKSFADAFKSGAKWQAKQSPWLNVREMLPKIGQGILMAYEYKGDVIIDTATFDGKYFHGEGLIFEKTEILGWLPTPSFSELTFS